MKTTLNIYTESVDIPLVLDVIAFSLDKTAEGLMAKLVISKEDFIPPVEGLFKLLGFDARSNDDTISIDIFVGPTDRYTHWSNVEQQTIEIRKAPSK